MNRKYSVVNNFPCELKVVFYWPILTVRIDQLETVDEMNCELYNKIVLNGDLNFACAFLMRA